MLLRKTSGLTQEALAVQLHVSSQAVSKWENGHSLPETALLPEIARLLDVNIDALFHSGSLTILEALFGDGIKSVNVTKRLNRLIEQETLAITVSSLLVGVSALEERACFLTLKYRTSSGICYAVGLEGEQICLSSNDLPATIPDTGLSIIAGQYGTRAHHYDVMHKIGHYRLFGWDTYHANHETFPSDPANDTTEYLTLVYTNTGGIHMATCAEGECLSYDGDHLIRQATGQDCFIDNIPSIPPFGEGMECSWAAALTAALQAMGVRTDYAEVMGASGACYRLAFCSPTWDYSCVDALVAYDYATPGFAAFGYTPVQYGHIEKTDRAEHRARIAKEIRSHMPVLGINLRVAPEWGVISGYEKDGEVLFCRTKYDKPTIENDPEFMKGHREFKKEWLGPYDYLRVDHWPFLLCYFDQKRKPLTKKETLIASLKIFVDSAGKTKKDGYTMGFQAYKRWASDLRDNAFYETCDDEQAARRFSVHQFCVLSLLDARKAAYDYLSSSNALQESEFFLKILACFQRIVRIAADLHQSLDSGRTLNGPQSRQFWTAEKRSRQAAALDQIASLEQEAYDYSQALIIQQDF